MCHWRRYNFRICYHYNDRDPNDYICYTDSPQCNRSGIGCRFRSRRYPGTKLLRRISCMGWRYLWRFLRCYRYLRSYLVKYNSSEGFQYLTNQSFFTTGRYPKLGIPHFPIASGFLHTKKLPESGHLSGSFL